MSLNICDFLNAVFFFQSAIPCFNQIAVCLHFIEVHTKIGRQPLPVTGTIVLLAYVAEK